MKIFLCGLPMSGKTTVGEALAKALNLPFVDTDREIEKKYFSLNGVSLTCREIYRKEGETYFRNLEQEVLGQDLKGIISLGGGAKVSKGEVIYLKADPKNLWKRIEKRGIPPFLDPLSPEQSFYEIAKSRKTYYETVATYTLEVDTLELEQIIETILWAVTPSGLFSESQRGENPTGKRLASSSMGALPD